MKKTWNRKSSIFHIFSILIPFKMQQWRRLFDNIALEIWRVCRSKCPYICPVVLFHCLLIGLSWVRFGSGVFVPQWVRTNLFEICQSPLILLYIFAPSYNKWLIILFIKRLPWKRHYVCTKLHVLWMYSDWRKLRIYKCLLITKNSLCRQHNCRNLSICLEEQITILSWQYLQVNWYFT